MTHWPIDTFYAESYEVIFSSRSSHQVEADLVLERAAVLGDPIVDVGCGSGKLLMALATAGYRVMGVESSPGQLRILQNRLTAQPAKIATRISVTRQNMFEMVLEEPFQICFSNSWYLTNDDAKIIELLRVMASHTTDSGCVIVSDFSWMTRLKPYWGTPGKKEAYAEDGSLFSHTKTYQYDQQRGLLRADVIVEHRSSQGHLIHSQPYSWSARFVDEARFAKYVEQAGCVINRVYEAPDINERWFELQHK